MDERGPRYPASVVPAAKDKKGRDIVDVKVSIDGKVVTETLDGKALPVDPGVHTFRFETKNAPPSTSRSSSDRARRTAS